MYADVAFNKPIEPLTYIVSENMVELQPGMRVLVEIKRKNFVGMVYRLKKSTNLKPQEIKPVIKILDKTPILNQDLIELAEWIADYYLCSVGEALWTIAPKGFSSGRKNKKVNAAGFPNGDENQITLTPDQEEVYNSLLGSFNNESKKNFLLYGITGSGKTEIYLRVIHRVVELGRGAILLVPEISLTPQTVRYFSKRMGDHLAILHSRLTPAEKLNEWRGILSGQKKVVIGARSAVFAPLNSIGIIIVDEEHETSYKSEETPRYNAKSVAYHRARKHGATLLFGSATPSVESFFLAKSSGQFELLNLPRRVLNQKLPHTRISDLRKVKGEKYISTPLFKAIEKRLKNREQVILFLNRRGYSPYVYCKNCGHVFKCRHCDITLTFHQKQKRLACHYCGYKEDPPEVCSNCGDEHINYSGFGTEKIEKVLNEYFPGAVVVRMDTDTVKRRTSLSEILGAFAKREIDILIGTQIVTKGLHFPEVTLVGVLNADIPLNFPDFRSAERTFNLITQVAGRAGRGEKGGEVIIQTYNPVHYAIQTAKNQDYEEFFIREMKYRENLIYPPLCRIIRLVFRGENYKTLFDDAGYAVSFIKENTSSYISLLGPAFCPFSRIKKNYRVHIIIKAEKIAPLKPVLRELYSLMCKKRYRQYLEIDIDPVNML